MAQHAIELLREPAESLERVTATLLYGVQDHLNALGRIDLARATLQAVLGWMSTLPILDRDLPARQRACGGQGFLRPNQSFVTSG